MLAYLQSHWLELLVLPGTAVCFSWAAMALARKYLGVFAPAAAVPAWVVLAGVPCAAVGVLSANVVRRARAPLLVHVAEVLGMLAVLYLALRITGRAAGTPFFSTAALRHPEVLGPAFVLLFGWYLAHTAGRAFARLGTVALGLGRQTALERAWLPEAIVSPEGMLAARQSVYVFFSRRTLGYFLFTAVLSAAAADSGVMWADSMWGWRWSVGLWSALLLFLGLLQQGCVYIYQVHTEGEEPGSAVAEPHFVRNWVMSTAALAAIVVAAGLVVPSGMAPFDFRSTAQAFTVRFTEFLASGVHVFNRFAMQHVDRRMPAVPSPPGPAGMAAEPGLAEGAALGITLLFYGMIVAGIAAFLAAAALWLLRGEWRRFGAAHRLPGLFLYTLFVAAAQFAALMRAALRGLLALIVRLLNATPDTVMERRRRRDRGSKAAAAGMSQEDEALPSAYIRRLFIRLIRAAAARGVMLRPEQTPYEFAASVKREVAGVDAQIDLLADKYVEARYGRRTVPPSPTLDRAWRDVAAALRFRRR